jgi:hypothetical protein
MATVMERGEEALMTMVGAATATPVRLTTTLYDLMATLQDMVGPQDETLVVATMVHLLHSRQCTWRGVNTQVAPLRAALRAPTEDNVWVRPSTTKIGGL